MKEEKEEAATDEEKAATEDEKAATEDEKEEATAQDSHQNQ